MSTSLALNDSQHRRTNARPYINGSIERFARTALDEFFRAVFRTTLYKAEEALKLTLIAGLGAYNTERPHPGYHSVGKRPIEIILLHLKGVHQEG